MVVVVAKVGVVLPFVLVQERIQPLCSSLPLAISRGIPEVLTKLISSSTPNYYYKFEYSSIYTKIGSETQIMKRAHQQNKKKGLNNRVLSPVPCNKVFPDIDNLSYTDIDPHLDSHDAEYDNLAVG